jgi:hypothetical protein
MFVLGYGCIRAGRVNNMGAVKAVDSVEYEDDQGLFPFVFGFRHEYISIY